MGPDLAVRICFSTSTSLISRLIRYFTKSKFSHAFLTRWSQDWLGWLGVGSQLGGWMEQAGENFETGGVSVVHCLVLPNINIWEGLRKNRKLLGAPYDIGGLLGMSWVEVLWRLFKLKVKNPLNSRKAWFCSEIIVKILKDSGLDLGLDPGSTDPEVLYEALVATGAVEEEYPVRLAA
jgi:hypothetical protein